MACWAHVRRKLYDVFKADNTSVAAVAITKIKELYEIERTIDAEPAEIRRRARKLSKLKILDFFVWADDVLAHLEQATAAIHAEDIVVNDLVWRGLNAPASGQGRLSPLERSIWQMNQWWLARMGA